MEITSESVLKKPTLMSLLQTIPSGIGIDASKNHTGVVIWNGEKLERYGFSINEYDKTDYFAEYKMRRQFNEELKKLVEGRYFEFCIIEDVYGGENFDTVRKLISINTVIDELIFEHTCTVNNFYRWNEPKWTSLMRTIYKQRGKLKAKVETQGVLEFLEDDFYLEHKDDSNAEKKLTYFEDICDATGMLLAVIANEKMNLNLVKQSSLRLSDIKMVYIEELEDIYGVRDERIRYELFVYVDLDYRNLEKSIIQQAAQNPEDVLCALLPSSKLGVFGMNHKFTFYDNDVSYLLFYKK